MTSTQLKRSSELIVTPDQLIQLLSERKEILDELHKVCVSRDSALDSMAALTDQLRDAKQETASIRESSKKTKRQLNDKNDCITRKETLISDLKQTISNLGANLNDANKERMSVIKRNKQLPMRNNVKRDCISELLKEVETLNQKNNRQKQTIRDLKEGKK